MNAVQYFLLSLNVSLYKWSPTDAYYQLLLSKTSKACVCTHAVYVQYEQFMKYSRMQLQFIWFSCIKKNYALHVKYSSFWWRIQQFCFFFGIGLLMKQLKHFWCCSCRCCSNNHVIFPLQYSRNPFNFPHTGRLHLQMHFLKFEFPHTSKKKTKRKYFTWNIPKLEWKKKIETYVRFIQFYEYCFLIDLAVASFHFIDCTILHFQLNCVYALCASIK